MKITKELLDNAETMQKDKIAFIDAMAKKDPKATYEALSDVYWYLKITELKQEINELREQLLPTLKKGVPNHPFGARLYVDENGKLIIP